MNCSNLSNHQRPPYQAQATIDMKTFAIIAALACLVALASAAEIPANDGAAETKVDAEAEDHRYGHRGKFGRDGGHH
ncbi:hypothetical protein JG687_00004958 [Phytophthora cactorum]|uniref:Uncharacterized protein n=1 Tax=Phytophthora cactorum TaxID=29920 RepID=A0A8T1UM86_9STRA|nr:hypothetical protein JG687_00004958 [Phytophthora cactorum]